MRHRGRHIGGGIAPLKPPRYVTGDQHGFSRKFTRQYWFPQYLLLCHSASD
jgi:hypothetical protein